MKSFYKLVVSDIKDKSADYLPYTVKTKFRSIESAKRAVGRYLKDNRAVTMVELCEEGTVATWSYENGGSRLVFDCNEELAEKVG